MKKEKFSKTKEIFSKFYHSGFYTVFTLSLGISLIIVSIFLYPDYNMITQYISTLGAATGMSAPFFNVGIFIIGLSSVQFYLSLSKNLRSKHINESLRKYTLLLSLIGGLSLSLVGIFPLVNFILSIFHYIVTIFFIASSVIYFSLFGYIMLKHSKFSKIHSYIGFGVAAVFALFLFLWIPLLEWLVFFAGNGWLLYNSVVLLIKNLREEV